MYLVVPTLALDSGWREPPLIHRILWFWGRFKRRFSPFDNDNDMTTTTMTNKQQSH